MRAGFEAWARRPLAGWLLLAVAAALALFYARVAWVATHPSASEAYRRTFVTGEFAVFPESTRFRPGNGLAYAPGAALDFARPADRRHLGRFDWRRTEAGAFLRGETGRLFLWLPPEARRPDRPHRVRLALTCRGAIALTVAVNGAPVAEARCADGALALDAAAPAGLVGARDYEEVAVSRPARSAAGRLAARLGAGFDALRIDRFVLEPVE